MFSIRYSRYTRQMKGLKFSYSLSNRMFNRLASTISCPVRILIIHIALPWLVSLVLSLTQHILKDSWYRSGHFYQVTVAPPTIDFTYCWSMTFATSVYLVFQLRISGFSWLWICSSDMRSRISTVKSVGTRGENLFFFCWYSFSLQLKPNLKLLPHLFKVQLRNQIHLSSF